MFTGALFILFFPLMMFFVISRVAAGLFRGMSRQFEPRERPQRVVEERDPGISKLSNFGIGKRPSMQSRVFRLAFRLKGKVTVSDVVLETGMELIESEEFLDHLIDGLRVRMEVSNGGLVTYEFPEIISRLENQ